MTSSSTLNIKRLASWLRLRRKRERNLWRMWSTLSNWPWRKETTILEVHPSTFIWRTGSSRMESSFWTSMASQSQTWTSMTKRWKTRMFSRDKESNWVHRLWVQVGILWESSTSTHTVKVVSGYTLLLMQRTITSIWPLNSKHSIARKCSLALISQVSEQRCNW